MKKLILFICTGNYYRSRFAAIYFNHVATKRALNWVAYSRGFFIENPDNIGQMCQFTVQELATLGIPLPKQEYPCVFSLGDLQQSDIVVALNEKEHKPMMEQCFPDWDNKVTFWHIADKQDITPSLALRKLREKIDELFIYVLQC